MIIPDIPFTLRDGRQALIRNPQEADIPEILDYLRVSAGETDFLLRYPEEYGRYTPEGEKALFERMNTADNEAMLICLVEGKIAGTCHIRWNKALKTGHRASIGIALLKEYWNQGVATEILTRLIEAAPGMGFSQIELSVVADNERAQALYRKLGFREIGRIPNALQYEDGSRRDEIWMVLLLEK